MKKLAAVTTTRADYGLLYPIIKGFRELENDSFKFLLIAAGTHFSEAFGNTVTEIENDGFRIDYSIKTDMKSDKKEDITRNISETAIEFTKIFEKEKPEGILILGDRYEMLGAAMASLISGVPIFHISGGDITEGAIDDSIRHAITKMAYLHFTTNEPSKKRVIQMGESPNRVFNVGSTSIDNVFNENLLSKEEVLKSIGLTAEKYIVCTYHPVTLSAADGLEEVKLLAEMLERFAKRGCHIVVTKANADLGGSRINEFWAELAKNNKNFSVFASLGRKRYLSLAKYALVVVGNSSSGIVEVPALKTPVVDIGDRQKGRTRSRAVLEADLEDSMILEAMIDLAISNEGKARAERGDNPYGDGKAAERIIRITMDWLEKGINKAKRFYDIGM